MALSGADSQGSFTEGMARTISGSTKGKWFVAHGDAKQTEDTGVTPLAVTQVGARWINVGVGMKKLHLRLRIPKTDTTTTAPSVTVWGLDAAVEVASTAAPTGLPRELLAIVALSKVVEVTDATFDYCVPNVTITDMLGSSAVLVVVSGTAVLANAGIIEGFMTN